MILRLILVTWCWQHLSVLLIIAGFAQRRILILPEMLAHHCRLPSPKKNTFQTRMDLVLILLYYWLASAAATFRCAQCVVLRFAPSRLHSPSSSAMLVKNVHSAAISTLLHFTSKASQSLATNHSRKHVPFMLILFLFYQTAASPYHRLVPVAIHCVWRILPVVFILQLFS